MRLPLVGTAPVATTESPSRRLDPGVASIALVPIDEATTLAFASLVAREIASLGASAHVVVEATSRSATSLPTALDVHGLSWSRIAAADIAALEDTFAKHAPVLLIGTGLALVVEASLVLGIARDAIPPLISAALREVRPRLDGIVTGARDGLATRLARRLVTRHP